MDEIDKAEMAQAVKAYVIPAGGFVACLLGAAGAFLIREGYALGWLFIGASAALIVTVSVCMLTFHNKLRASGLMKDPHDSPAPDLEDGTPSEAKSSASLRPQQSASKPGLPELPLKS